MRNLNDFTIKSVLLRYNSVLKRLNILIFLLVVAAEAAMAQYDVEFSHYFDMEPYYNAAAVGKQDKLNIVGAYSMQFAGFEHNPRTMFISADAPFIFLNSYHGAGVQILNDKLGFFTHQRIAVQYALKRPLFGGTLSDFSEFLTWCSPTRMTTRHSLSRTSTETLSTWVPVSIIHTADGTWEPLFSTSQRPS